MNIYTISDLHLPLGIDKPMDIFGNKWKNYVDRLKDNWQNTVSDNDIVVMGGDFSWATYLEESLKDFLFLENLPGKKILLKGNHDYWWSTASKLTQFVMENNIYSVSFLHNNSYKTGDIGICGTRGWSLDNLCSLNGKKIYERELIRLRLSLENAVSKGCKKLFVFTHYPPVTNQLTKTSFHNILSEFGVEKCFYGHLHGNAVNSAFEGFAENTEYKLVSADYVKFMPVFVSIGGAILE